ncbi:thiamine phosphate synthase [Halobacillus sp. A5]|uniref:thiamine phosphate synthase n=1 Tax=Halobacillus sp. A5 TaxID=2880263 RepID=UPI0020A687AD|nr:thiamine phosphate synthase [Halobacillus sp. A5]MCP3028564.1 thiamine phosphate synthase [Halobacillus sp. A5]
MKLTAVTNGKLNEEQLLPIIKEIEPLVDSIVLREKQKSPQAYLEFVNALLKARIPAGKLRVHSHADIACMTGVHNLHLPEKGMTVREVKKAYPFLHTGQAVHSLSSAIQAEEEGADYIMFGHIFPTESKKGMKSRGLKQLREITSALSIPVIAIGGITIENIKKLTSTKAEGAAVMSGIFNASSPIESARLYQKEVRELNE